MSKSENKVLKAGLGYTVGNYFIRGLTFLTIPIFSRLLSPSEYGIYNTFVAYEAILSIFIGLALHGSYKKAKYDLKETYNTYVSDTLVFIALNAIVACVICNLLGGILESTLGLDKISINLLIVYSFAMAVIICYNSYLGLEYRYKSFIIVSFLNAVGTIGISILLMLTIYDENRYMGRVIGTAIPTLLIAICLLVILWKKQKPNNIVKNVKWGLAYSLPLVPHGISQVVLSQFDRIMIRTLIGTVEAGIYSFAYNIFSIINITTTSLGNVWEPWAFEKMNKGNYEEIKKVGTLYAGGMLVFSAIVMLVAPEIIMLLGTSEYVDAVYSVVPIVAGGYFAFLYTLPATVEYYRGKTKFIAVGTVSAAVINIVLNAVFIPQYGYITAAYTTLFSYLGYFIFHYLVAWRIEKRCIFNTKAIIICCLSIFGFIFISLLLLSNFVIRWAIAVVLVALVFVVEEGKVGLIRRKIKGI